MIQGGASSGPGTHILANDTGIEGASSADIDGTWRNAFATADRLTGRWSGGIRADFSADAVFVAGSGQPKEYVGLAAFTVSNDLSLFGFTMAGFGTGFDEVKSVSQYAAGKRIVYSGDRDIYVGVSGGPLLAEIIPFDLIPHYELPEHLTPDPSGTDNHNVVALGIQSVRFSANPGPDGQAVRFTPSDLRYLAQKAVDQGANPDETGYFNFIGSQTRQGDDVKSIGGTDMRDVLFGGPNDEILRGKTADDILIGGGGKNVLHGGGGDDHMIVEDGDFAFGAAGVDVVILYADPAGAGGARFDLNYDRSDPMLPAELAAKPHGVEHLVGTEGNDTLKGTGEGTFIEGGDGDDEIYLYGMDIGYGGAGADRFYFEVGADRPDGASAGDDGGRPYLIPTIIDLEPEDKIYINGVQFTGASYSGTAQTDGSGETAFISNVSLRVSSTINEIDEAEEPGEWDRIGDGLFPIYFVSEDGSPTGYGGLTGNVPSGEGDGASTLFSINIAGFEIGDGGLSYSLAYLNGGGNLPVGNGSAVFDSNGDFVRHYRESGPYLADEDLRPSLHDWVEGAGFQAELPEWVLEREELATFFTDPTAFIPIGEYDVNAPLSPGLAPLSPGGPGGPGGPGLPGGPVGGSPMDADALQMAFLTDLIDLRGPDYFIP